MQSYFFLVHRTSAGASVHTIPLQLGDSTVGRSVKVQIPLMSENISRTHAIISVDPKGVVIRDMNSRNGTFVNGVRVRDVCSAFAGDTIQLGDIEYILSRDPNGDAGIDASTSTRDIRTLKKKSPPPVLSPAVQRVFDCLTQGLSDKEIASQLHRSIHTVHNHIKAIFLEYQVKSRIELLLKVLPRTEAQ